MDSIVTSSMGISTGGPPLPSPLSSHPLSSPLASSPPIPLSQLLACAVDYLFESLVDLQREFALLPSSADSADVKGVLNDAVKTQISESAEKRRGLLLTWVNRAISMLVQLYVCTVVSKSSSPADVDAQSMAGLSAAIRQTRVAISSLDASDNRYVTVLNTLGSIPMQMRRTAKPRYAVRNANYLFRHGVAPHSQMPRSLYAASQASKSGGIESLLAIRQAELRRAKQYSRQNNVHVPMTALSCGGPALPASTLPSVVSSVWKGETTTLARRQCEVAGIVSYHPAQVHFGFDFHPKSGLLGVHVGQLLCKFAVGPAVFEARRANWDIQLVSVCHAHGTNELYANTRELSPSQLEGIAVACRTVLGKMSAATQRSTEPQTALLHAKFTKALDLIQAIVSSLTLDGFSAKLMDIISRHQALPVVAVRPSGLPSPQIHVVLHRTDRWARQLIRGILVRIPCIFPRPPPLDMVRHAIEQGLVLPDVSSTPPVIHAIVQSLSDALSAYCSVTAKLPIRYLVWQVADASSREHVAILPNLRVSEVEAVLSSDMPPYFQRISSYLLARWLKAPRFPQQVLVDGQNTEDSVSCIIDEFGRIFPDSLVYASAHLDATARYLGVNAQQLADARKAGQAAPMGQEFIGTSSRKTEEVMFNKHVEGDEDAPVASPSRTLLMDLTTGLPTCANPVGAPDSTAGAFQRLSQEDMYSLYLQARHSLCGVQKQGFRKASLVALEGTPQRFVVPLLSDRLPGDLSLPRSVGAYINVYSQYHYTGNVSLAKTGKVVSSFSQRQPYQRQVDQAIRAYAALLKSAEDQASQRSLPTTSVDVGRKLLVEPVQTYFAAVVTAMWSHFHLLGWTRSPALTERIQVTALLAGMILSFQRIVESLSGSPQIVTSIDALLTHFAARLSQRFHHSPEVQSSAVAVAHLLSPACCGQHLDGGVHLEGLPPGPSADILHDNPLWALELGSKQASEDIASGTSDLLACMSQFLRGEGARAVETKIPTPGVPTYRPVLIPPGEPAGTPRVFAPDSFQDCINKTQFNSELAALKMVHALLLCSTEGAGVSLSSGTGVPALRIHISGAVTLRVSMHPQTMMPLFQVEDFSPCQDAWRIQDLRQLVEEMTISSTVELHARWNDLASLLRSADKTLGQQLELALRTQRAAGASQRMEMDSAAGPQVVVCSGLLNPLDADLGASLLTSPLVTPGQVAAVVDRLCNLPDMLLQLPNTSDATSFNDGIAAACDGPDSAAVLLRHMAARVKRPAGAYSSVDPGQIAGPFVAARDVGLVAVVSLVVSHYCDILALLTSHANSGIHSRAQVSADLAASASDPAKLACLLRAQAPGDLIFQKDVVNAFANAAQCVDMPKVSHILRVLKHHAAMANVGGEHDAVHNFTLTMVCQKFLAVTATVVTHSVVALLRRLREAESVNVLMRSTHKQISVLLPKSRVLAGTPSFAALLRPRFLVSKHGCLFGTQEIVQPTDRKEIAGMKRRLEPAAEATWKFRVGVPTSIHMDRMVFYPLTEPGTTCNKCHLAVDSVTGEMMALVSAPLSAPVTLLSTVLDSVHPPARYGTESGLQTLSCLQLAVKEAMPESKTLLPAILASATALSVLTGGVVWGDNEGSVFLTGGAAVQIAPEAWSHPASVDGDGPLDSLMPHCIAVVQLPSQDITHILQCTASHGEQLAAALADTDWEHGATFGYVCRLLRRAAAHKVAAIALVDAAGSANHPRVRQVGTSPFPCFVDIPGRAAAEPTRDCRLLLPMLMYAQGASAATLLKAAGRPNVRMQLAIPIPEAALAWQEAHEVKAILQLGSNMLSSSSAKRLRTGSAVDSEVDGDRMDLSNVPQVVQALNNMDEAFLFV